MMRFRPMFALDQDHGGAGGGTSSGGDDPGKSTSGAGSSSGGKDSQDKGSSESKTTDSDPDDPAALKLLLKQAREERDQLFSVHTLMKTKYEKRATEEEKARQENLKKQGEFAKLLEEQTPRFEAAQALAKRQEAALSSYLEAELKSIPESFKALIPEGDSVSKLEWITKAKASGAFAAQAGAGKGKSPDGTPPPGGSSTTSITREAFERLGAREKMELAIKKVKIVD